MSSFINLIISFVMGLFFGQQMEDPKTTHHDLEKNSTEIFQKLESRQQVLDC